VASAGRLRSVKSQGEGAGIGGDADVRYKCAKCKSVLESPAAMAGQQDRCPMCNHVNTVPAARLPKRVKSSGKKATQEVAVGDEDKGGQSVFDEASDALLDLQVRSNADALPTQEANPINESASAQRGAVSPPPELDSDCQWFYVSGADQIGPVPFAVVRDLVRSGHLKPSSMVWHEGMAKWAQLGATPEFCSISTASAAPDPMPVYQPQQAQPSAQGPMTGFTCPFCHRQGPPIITQKISGGGWILFVILLLFCLPLCWLPFVMDGCKDSERRCAGCGTRLG